ncbi:sugar transferase [Aurantivibrio plasticivorans]
MNQTNILSSHPSHTIIRLFDIFLSVLGLSVTAPIILIITIIGTVDTGSPIFLQKRLGKNKKIFTLIKFRTMHRDTASIATHLASSTSVTKFGGFLRRTKLDELPQLINVLLGNMSLVGPRPGLPNQVDLTQYRDEFDIFKVRPGITGLGQIMQVDMSTPRKLARYDSVMITRMSVTLYISLIFSTMLGKGSGDKIQKNKA